MIQDKQRQEKIKTHLSTIYPTEKDNQPQPSKWWEDSKIVTEKKAKYFPFPLEQNSELPLGHCPFFSFYELHAEHVIKGYKYHL